MDRYEFTPLMHAAFGEHLYVVKLLVEIQPNGLNPAHVAVNLVDIARDVKRAIQIISTPRTPWVISNLFLGEVRKQNLEQYIAPSFINSAASLSAQISSSHSPVIQEVAESKTSEENQNTRSKRKHQRAKYFIEEASEKAQENQSKHLRFIDGNADKFSSHVRFI